MPMKIYMKNTMFYMLIQTVNAIENLFMDGQNCVKTISIYNFF